MAVHQRPEVRHDLLFSLCFAAMLVIVGISTHRGVIHDARQSFDFPSDSRIYLSMVAHDSRSAGQMAANPVFTTDPAWTLYNVDVPFRYRILVPWLARQLPFEPVFSLPLVNYLSLGGAYVFLLLTCRRLGATRLASMFGLAIAFTFVPHLPNYSEPWLTDGFILLVLSAMTYAFVIDSFFLFAAWGLVGVFAREVPAVILPVWCVRDLKRGIVVTAIAVAAVGVERAILIEPSGPTGMFQPTWLLHAAAQTIAKGPAGASYWPPRQLSWSLLTAIEATWLWAFAIVPVGLFLLPRDSLARFVPIASALVVSAFGMSLVATDTAREFGVMMPVVVVAIAHLVAALVARKQVLWLAVLLSLAGAQLCLSEPNVILGRETWATWSVGLPVIKIGVAWTLVAGILVRRELAGRMSELWRAANAG